MEARCAAITWQLTRCHRQAVTTRGKTNKPLCLQHARIVDADANDKAFRERRN